MKVQLANNTVVSALLYTFPKKGNAPEGFHLFVGDTQVPAAMTGGGKFPTYTYFMLDGTSYYLPKNVNPASGEKLVVVAEVPKAVKEAKPVVEGEVSPETPAKPAKPARKAK